MTISHGSVGTLPSWYNSTGSTLPTQCEMSQQIRAGKGITPILPTYQTQLSALWCLEMHQPGNPKGAVITSVWSLCTAWPFTSLWASVPQDDTNTRLQCSENTQGKHMETTRRRETHTKTRHTRWQSYPLLDKGGPGWPYVTWDELGQAQKGWDFLCSPTYRQRKSSHGGLLWRE